MIQTRLVCEHCNRQLDPRETGAHGASCAQERITKLERRVAALSKAFDRVADQLADAGLIPEFRP